MPREATRLQPLRGGNQRSSYTNPFVAERPSEQTERAAPVENAVAFSVQLLRGCFICWLAGWFSLSLKAAQLLPDCSWYVAATPVWAGNLLLAALQANLVLRVGLCFGHGRVLSESDYRVLSMTPGSKATLEHSISEDSTLLVTRAIAGVMLSVPVLLLVSATEILLCGYMETGTPNIWTCLAPLILVQLVSVIQVLLIRNSAKAIACQVLFLTTTLSVAAAAEIEASSSASHQQSQSPVSWGAALLPLWVLNALFFFHFAVILTRYFGGRYVLSAQQLLCCGLFLVSGLLTSSGEAMLVYLNHPLPRQQQQQQDEQQQQPTAADYAYDPFMDLYFPLSTVFFGAFLFVVAALVMVQEHAHWLVVTKGFGEPLPLSINEDGTWESSFGHDAHYDLFLGNLVNSSEQARPGQQQQVHFAGIAGSSRSSSQVEQQQQQHFADNSLDALPTIHSDNYDSGCDSAAFNDIYGGNTTGPSGAEESS